MEENMKLNKIYLVLATLIITFSISTPVFALSYSNDKKILEVEIEKATSDYLIDKKSFSISDLTKAEELELSNIIQTIKEASLESVVTPKWYNPWLYGTTENITGYIFITLDNSTFGWEHGHAGIGNYTGGSVIEANPGVGVKLYGDRVNTYWHAQRTGGIYKVKNATSTDYMYARNYAYSQIGKSYNVAPYNSGFYCSELVYKAWKSAGFYVAPKSAVEFYTPLGIMNDADTVKIASFPF